MEHGSDGFRQPTASVGHEQLHSAQAAGLYRAEEFRPEGFVLGVTNIEAENFTASVRRNPNGHDDRMGEDSMVDPGFAIGGIKEDVWVVERGEVPIAEDGDLLVQTSANP